MSRIIVLPHIRAKELELIYKSQTKSIRCGIRKHRIRLVRRGVDDVKAVEEAVMRYAVIEREALGEAGSDAGDAMVRHSEIFSNNIRREAREAGEAGEALVNNPALDRKHEKLAKFILFKKIRHLEFFCSIE